MSPRLRFTRPDVPILNRDSPQVRGLVAWWPVAGAGLIDVQTGRRAVLSSSGMSGTRPPFFRAFPSLGAVLQIDPNQGSYVDTLTPVDLSAVTLVGWVSVSGFSEVHYLCGEGNTRFQINDSSTLQFTLAGIVDQASSAAALVSNAPMLLAVSYNRSSIDFWLNGRLVSSHAQTALPSNASTWYLLARNTGGAAQATEWAAFADFRVYSRALSVTEHWALYDPATRWDLYWQRRRTFFIPAGGGGSVYNQTLTLSAATTKTASGRLTMAPVVSLSAGGGAAQNGPTTMALLASMTARLEQVASVGLTQQVTTALALLGAQVVNGVLTITPSGTLATALTSSSSSAYQLNPNVTLDSVVSLTTSVKNTLALALTLTSPASLLESLVGGTHNLSLTIGLQTALAEALAASLNQTLVLAAQANIVPTPLLTSLSTIGLLAQAAQTVSGSTTMSASVLLSLLDGIASSLIGQSYSASTSLGMSSGLNTSMAQTMAANLLLSVASNLAEIAQATCNTAFALGITANVTPTLVRQINAMLSLQLSAQLLELADTIVGGGPEIVRMVAFQLRVAALVDLGLNTATLSDTSVN